MRRVRPAVVVVVVVLGLQIGLPLHAMVRHDVQLQRFGWQMFAHDSTKLRASATTDQVVERIDLTDIIPHERPEIDYTGLAAHLCALHPEADVVTVARDVPRLHVAHRC